MVHARENDNQSDLTPHTGRQSHYSTISSQPTINTSSSRTTFSNRSVFSTPSHYEEPLAEDDYVDSPYAGNVQMEPVERGSRTGSRQGDHVSKASQAPFARALAKMESASARIISTRLGEEWEGLEDDESFQEVMFEKRLWALTAYQRLTQNKQLQSPAHETLSSSRPADQRRILHLHGSLGKYFIFNITFTSTNITIQPMVGCWPQDILLPLSTPCRLTKVRLCPLLILPLSTITPFMFLLYHLQHPFPMGTSTLLSREQ